MNTIRKLRCAVYTRKSSEEGLDQEFNSLDAQREACSAFIASQVGLGWKLVSDRYDDGGISGGTMQRPALLRLLDDIRSKRVDVVVVYKIDRLTRSLSDFARIVDVFDGNGVSFVSVTQQFNTTTSMGRLTLNVLLSFAQFEREVTAERIRDKIAAAKAKGMWMGGTVPLGYEVTDRKLIVREPEASFVRALFARYLELKSVPALAAEMTRNAALAEKASNATHAPPAHSNTFTGAIPYTRRVHSGMLYKLLSNPLYIGKLRHRDLVHNGEHQPLVDDDLFNAVQALLAANAVKPRGSRIHPSDHQMTAHLLTGLLYDDTGDCMSPTHAKAHGRRYRYYVSSRIKASKRTDPSSWRIPAPELDRTVVQFASRILNDHGQLIDWIKTHAPDANIQGCLEATQELRAKLNASANVSKTPANQGWLESQREHAGSDRLGPRKSAGKPHADLSQAQPHVMSSYEEHRAIVTQMFSRITLGTEAITFLVDVQGVIRLLKESPVRDLRSPENDPDLIALQLAITVKRRGNEMRLIVDGDQMTRAPDPSLVTLVAKAHVYFEQLTSAPGLSVTDVANIHRVHRADVGRLLPLAFLAPKLLDHILSGSQPAELSARFLARTELPHLWTEQMAPFS